MPALPAPAKLILVGDSDIERWPKHMLPFADDTRLRVRHMVSGTIGATLNEIIPELESILLESRSQRTNPSSEVQREPMLVIACAGENDVGNGLTLNETRQAFDRLLDLMELHHARLIFLGPKLEPWMIDDLTSRKHYIRMSRSMEKSCRQHSHSSYICFVDCLNMFCDSAHERGALMGSRAQADPQYFEADQLHLSEQGYQLWKKKLEESILSLLR